MMLKIWPPPRDPLRTVSEHSSLLEWAIFSFTLFSFIFASHDYKYRPRHGCKVLIYRGAWLSSLRAQVEHRFQNCGTYVRVPSRRFETVDISYRPTLICIKFIYKSFIGVIIHINYRPYTSCDLHQHGGVSWPQVQVQGFSKLELRDN